MSSIALEGFRPALQQTAQWSRAEERNAVLYLTLALPEGIDRTALRTALAEVLERNEILRTRLVTSPGMDLPVQVIADQVLIDWREADAAEPDAALKSSLREALDQPQPPALAVALLPSTPATLLLAVPAATADITTLEQLLQEWQALYQGSELPEPSVQFADFAEWQFEHLSSSDSDAGRAFWQRQQAPDLLVAMHPFQRSQANAARQMACVEHKPDLELQDRLNSALAGLDTPAPTLFGLCWAVLLQRHLGQSQVLLGWEHQGRNSATAGALGPYAKRLPLLPALDDHQSLSNALAGFSSLLKEAQAWQEEWPVQSQSTPFGFRMRQPLSSAWPVLALEGEPCPHALLLDVTKHAGGFDFRLHYDAATLDASGAQMLLDQFMTLTLQASASSSQALRDANGISTVHQHWLAALNQTRNDLPAPALLQQLFEAQVELQPDAIAITHGDLHLSYRALERQANQVAHQLRKAGLAAGQPVGLFMGRCTEAIVGILGILKAGGAYLPLDPSYPAERLSDMLEQTRAPLLLSLSGLQARLPKGDYATLWLDQMDADSDHEQRPEPITDADSLAYLIFTSGSTGRPKGVMVSHRNAVHSTSARFLVYQEPLEAFLLVSGLSFDSSVAGLFWTLGRGARLCLPHDDLVQDALALGRLIATQRISHTLMLPSLYAQVLEQAADQMGSLRCAIVAGEACPASLARQHRERCSHAQLYNEYGPTEGTVWCTCYPARGDEQGVLPIGKAIPNMQVYVLDEHLQPVAAGVTGEIYLSGAGISQGYLGRPDLSAERFLNNPLDPAGTALYRSGDLGRLNPQGDIEFLGRVDDQVKIRGFRIELGEIEARLLTHPGVREAAVVARPNDLGDTELVAYLVARDVCPGAIALQAYLSTQVPEHMLPSAYVMLPAFPLTPNGKLDRKALPAPARERQASYRAPRNERETLLAELWSQVLGVERVGLDDNFFELGGHSLTATRLVSRLRSSLGLEVPVRALFQHPTLGAFVEQALPKAQVSTLPKITAQPRNHSIPMSYAQERLWLFDRLHPGSTTYNVPESVRLHGDLDLSALERSFTALLQRHEGLRTTFTLEHAQPVQRISPAQHFTLSLIDLSLLSDGERQQRLLSELQAQAAHRFDLEHGPLIRAGVVRLSAQEHVLWLTLHHIVFDGWSMRVFTRELTQLYSAFSKGQPSPLSEPQLHYPDFAQWQRRELNHSVLKPQLDFWLQHLGADRTLLQLPCMLPRPALPSHRGGEHSFELGQDMTHALHTYSREQGATLFMTLLAAFNVLLAGHSAQQAVRIGIPIANRHHQELEGLIGFFVNTLALRTDMTGNPGFKQVLEQVRTHLLNAHANQDLPFEQLLQALPNSQQHSAPLVQVMFDLHRERSLTSSEFGELTIAPMNEDTGKRSTLFDLMLDVSEREQGLIATFTYSTDVFEHASIVALGEDLRALLDTVLNQTAPSFDTLVQQLTPMSRPRLDTRPDSRAQVMQALQEVLGQTVLDDQANFFEAGGSSLKAVLLCAHLQALWGTKIPAHLVFLNPLLADLTSVLSRYSNATQA
ncbi:amino acid adenylation domain-containing protein [Pseudomonas sp. MAFF 302030]|uniref:Amino acid adenylation domain-containing protein n=1 Tax=Pseudomonas morbosilactucae TaxID=2938197 RepID=A0A9X1YZ30_9PSED|nr:non-ribosomal peptide synthetase [Pseudomonas morbosilactucae]MCK9800928.1 amino acid adenylation domain-containing protein [Pseudomonas morbosilactucae]